jgi:hypothetical protein
LAALAQHLTFPVQRELAGVQSPSPRPFGPSTALYASATLSRASELLGQLLAQLSVNRDTARYLGGLQRRSSDAYPTDLSRPLAQATSALVRYLLKLRGLGEPMNECITTSSQSPTIVGLCRSAVPSL